MSRTEDGRRKTERLDVAIDRAVREMLDVEPPDGLRGRVLDRIESPRRRLTWIWIAAPLAAAAILVLAVLLPSKTPRTVVNPVATVATSQPAAQPQPVVPPMKVPTSAVPTRVSVPRTRPTSPAIRGIEDGLAVAAVVPADDASVIDLLTPIAPIVVAGTHPADIAPKDIAISPMAPIAPLQIAPLSPPERRN